MKELTYTFNTALAADMRVAWYGVAAAQAGVRLGSDARGVFSAWGETEALTRFLTTTPHNPADRRLFAALQNQNNNTP